MDDGKSRFIELFGTIDLSVQDPEWKKLGSVGTILTGSTPKTSVPDYWDGDIKWITPAELDSESFIIYETERTITDAGKRSCSLNVLEPGVVLLTSRAPIGKVAIVGSEMYCNQGFKNIKCGLELNNIYLYTLLRYNTDYLNSLGRGATFKEVSAKIVADIRIPVPTRDKQDAFAAFVEQVGELKMTCKQIFWSFDNLVKSRFIEMFGKREDYHRIWTMGSFNDCCQVMYGYPFDSTFFNEDGNGTRLIRIRDINTGPSETYTTECVDKQYLIKNGDLLVSMDGDFRAILWNSGPALLNQRTCKMSGKTGTINDIFLLYYLRSELDIIHSKTSATTVKHLSAKEINKFSVPMPPLTMQNEFAEFVKQVDKSKFTVQITSGHASDQGLI